MPEASLPPSSVTDTVAGDTSTCGGSSTSTSKLLALACGAAPPATLVPLSPVKSAAEPSSTSYVSPLGLDALGSAVLSVSAISSSVATRTVSVACPVNVTFGAAVFRPDSATPLLMLLPVFFASVQSPVVTLVPPISSGTTIVSPAPRARPRVTVNAALPPSVMAPLPVRASDTSVASPSVTVTVCDTAAPARTSGGSVPRLTRNDSSGSSSASSVIATVAVPDVAPDAIGMLAAPV